MVSEHKFGDVLHDEDGVPMGMFVGRKGVGYTGPGITDNAFPWLIAMFNRERGGWQAIEDWPDDAGWEITSA